MLDEQDLQAIARLILESEARTAKRFEEVDKRFREVYERLGVIDKRLARIDKRLDRVDKQIVELKEMDEFILTEVCNVYKNLDERITQMDDRLKEVQDYYRIHKLTDENTALLMELYRKLEGRMDAVEQGGIQKL